MIGPGGEARARDEQIPELMVRTMDVRSAGLGPPLAIRAFDVLCLSVSPAVRVAVVPAVKAALGGISQMCAVAHEWAMECSAA
eukprot:3811381-Pyramimonas_sp.AAC.1